MNRDEALFYEAMELGTPAAGAFLDRACVGDDGLRQRVERLLAAHAEGDSLLDLGPSVAAATCELPSSVFEKAGDRIGSYKLIQQLGEGGMGVVYMAQQTEPVKRLVALKIIKPGMDSRQVIARFEAERQALALMEHPNIARIFDAGVTGEIQNSERRMQNGTEGRPYFVMELVKGIPITEYCEEKRLTARERLELFLPVCLAVQHAHQKGIIHRDLKPSNVLVALYDGQPVPKVIDFGVAKATGGQLTEKTLVTNFGSLVGTLEYMSPEQAELNQLDVDTRSDIYSLGVLLYELLTGGTPVDRERLRTATFGEKLRMIREEEAETVSARIAKTKSAERGAGSAEQRVWSEGNVKSKIQNLKSSELDWIVAKSLEKERSRRYESASALAADIQRYLSDEPVLACPPTIMYRFQKFARKHKPALATAAAIAACLILGTTVSAWQAVRATTAEAQANANEQKANVNAAQAQEKAQEATTQRDEAQKQRDEVKALADKLAAKEQQLQRTLYAAHMNVAQNAWDADGIRRVNELLEQHRPKPGETDLRGFEWHYLYHLTHPELLTLRAPNPCVAFSPDGKRLAIAHAQSTQDEKNKRFAPGEVRVCDAQTGQELVSCKGHTGKIDSVTFSPDGKRLASASKDNTVKVWDAQTGKELLTFKGHAESAWSVAFSPDGKRLASASKDLTVKVWDAQTGRELLTIKGFTDYVNCVVFSPDGQRLASGSNEKMVQVWNAQTGEELLSIKADAHHVASVAFSPDGQRLFSGGGSGVKLWDAQTGQELVSIKARTGQFNGVAYSPDGKRVASVGLDQAVRVWDAQSGEEIVSFKGHTGWVSGVAFDPAGTRLASAGNDGTVRIWDVSTRQEANKFSGANFRRRSVGFSPDGKRVTGTAIDSVTRETTTKVWDAQTGQELISIKPPARARIVALSPDGKRLAAGSGTYDETKQRFLSGEVTIWNSQTGEVLATLMGHKWPVVDLAFSPDSSQLVSCGSNLIESENYGTQCEVKVWNVVRGEELLEIKGHKSHVHNVAFSPDGKRLATVSRDRTLKVWDAKTGEELLSMPVEVFADGAVAFSPVGNRLASSNKPPNAITPHQAGEVKLWNAQTGEEIFTLEGHAGSVTSLAFSSDGKRLASSTGGGPGPPRGHEVKVWDTETGEELLTFKEIGSGGVAFSPDGHRLVSAGSEGLKIFDATPVTEKP